jgi:hypothetical protein
LKNLKFRITVFVFLAFASHAFFAQKNFEIKVKQASVSACKTNCSPGSKLLTSQLRGKSYFLHMQIEESCSDYDTVYFQINSDTIEFEMSQKEFKHQSKVDEYILKKSKGPHSLFCICYYDVKIEIINLKKQPRFIKFGSQFWNGLFWGDLEEYTRYSPKKFGDNTDSLSYEKLKACLGKNINSSEFASVIEILGNDSIHDFGSEAYIDFIVDEISFTYNSFNEITGIRLTDYIKKHPTMLFYIGNRKGMLDNYLGDAEVFEKGQCIDYDENGAEKYIDCWFDCYYRSEYLRVKFDKDKKIKDIELRF